MVSFKPKPAFLKLQADLDLNFKRTDVCEFDIFYWKWINYYKRLDYK